MSHVRIASIALVGLALSTAGAVEPAAEKVRPKTTEQALVDLIQENDRLRAENAGMRDQIKRLQTQLAEYRFFPQNQIPKALPPGWKQGTYNGLPLYLIPCETTSTAAVTTPTTPTK